MKGAPNEKLLVGVSYSMGIVASFWNIPDPLFGLVPAFLLYSQIPDPQATSREHWHLEFHWDWRLLPRLLVPRRRQVRHCGQYLLLVTLKLFDSPEYWGFIRFILSLTISCWKDLDLRGVGRHWDLYDHIVCIVSALKYGANLDGVFDATIIRVFLDYGRDLEGQINVLTNTVRHNLEQSIRRDERYRTVTIEPAKSDALVELDVINLDSLLLLFSVLGWGTGWFPEQEFIVDAEFALWHAR